MRVEFSKKFSKDLDGLGVKSVKQNLRRIIELIESADSLDKIPNLKKLKGHKSAYRVRVGDYRLGFFFENSTILIGRFLHRKEIYKMFP
jgi:mRNA interferase RelE/StbE